MKTKAEWMARLRNRYAVALAELTPSYELDDQLSAGEVLDAIVDYEGGIASGYQIRSLVEEVYGIELNREEW